jgi:hypothetical protein
VTRPQVSTKALQLLSTALPSGLGLEEGLGYQDRGACSEKGS